MPPPLRLWRNDVLGSRLTPVVTAEEMRALDRAAAERYGIPSLLLMENAGRAVADEAVRMLGGSVDGRGVLVLCGPGNNGGDGFVAARHLNNAGAQVTIAHYGDPERSRGDALTNLTICRQMRLCIEQSPSARRLASLGRECDIVIDALLGTGTTGEIREPYSTIIPFVNDIGRRGVGVLAVDIPSGVDADTGTVSGAAVRADVTVTFALPKIGLVTYPGAALVGRLVIADIGIPREAYGDIETFLLDRRAASALVRRREPHAHKGDCGHVAIVAGSVGMTGAAALAAEGALRAGAGLVTLAIPESLNDILEVKVSEAMTLPVPEGVGRAFGRASLESVLEAVSARDAAVIGPGFGRNEDTVDFALQLVRSLNRPAVIDADALFAVSREPGALRKCRAPVVITPHPGEMALLTGTGADAVQSNRLEAARAFAREYGVFVVLKGAGTVAAAPDGKAFVNTTGTPGMATGGSGDVLSGMIGAALAGALGELDPLSAACACIYLHGRAGEIAVGALGEHAMLASDLAAAIGPALTEVSRENAERE